MTTSITLIALAVVIGSVISSPMYYKKTDDDTYEPGKIFELLSMNLASINGQFNRNDDDHMSINFVNSTLFSFYHPFDTIYTHFASVEF